MNSVIIVETPLQLLNAIEASFSLNLSNITLVIVTSPPFPKEVFSPILAFAKWKQIEFLYVVHNYSPLKLSFLGRAVSEQLNEYVKECRQAAKRRRFDRLAKRLVNVDTLVLGSYLSGYMRHLANKLRPRKLYLVDDGTDTLRVSNLRREQAVPEGIQQLPYWRKLKNLIRTSFVDWDTRQADSATFFTSYKLTLIPEDTLIRNDHSFLKSMLNHSGVLSEVYFLGQPLVEDGYLQREDYLAYISRISQYYRSRTLIYVTHKRESQQMIDAVRNMGLQVRTFNLPIELQILQGGIPSELASFFCSALDNCFLIFGDNLSIKAFRIQPKHLNPGCEFVQDIYDHFSRNVGPNFNIVPLQGNTAGPWD